MLKLGVLASHGGTNLQAIIDACEGGVIDVTIAVVISNNSGSGALSKARKAGLEAVHVSTVTDQNTDEAICKALESRGVELVALAGYVKQIGPRTLARYRRKIINIHPALLPTFGGKGFFGGNVHAAVIESGVRFSGPTAHFVDAEYDTGPIIAQSVVPVLDNDTPETLAARVLIEEHSLYPEVIGLFARNLIGWRDERVIILPES